MHATAKRVVRKNEIPPEAEAVVEQFYRQWGDTLQAPKSDLIDAVQSGRVDPSDVDSLRRTVSATFGNYTGEFEAVIRPNLRDGAEAGRAAMARRAQLNITFDRVPSNVLEEFDDFASEAVGEALDTMTEDVTNFVRSAQREGLSIDEIADTLGEDMFEGRLETWQARRTARTTTIPSSNAGSHSALQDADSVVGEEWLATGDQRTRDSHEAADGQIVPVDGTFLVGGNEARYPGDPQLPIDEIANERCSLAPVFADDLSEQELAALEAGQRLNT